MNTHASWQVHWQVQERNREREDERSEDGARRGKFRLPWWSFASIGCLGALPSDRP